MLVKCSNLTQCVVSLSSKAEMLEFLGDRSRSLGSEIEKLKPSLFNFQRLQEIEAELALILSLQKAIGKETKD